MSARLTVLCLFCDAEHECTVSDGERATYDYPGSGPEVDWVKAGCDCGEHPAVDHFRFWELMDERAMEEARSAARDYHMERGRR